VYVCVCEVAMYVYVTYISKHAHTHTQHAHTHTHTYNTHQHQHLFVYITDVGKTPSGKFVTFSWECQQCDEMPMNHEAFNSTYQLYPPISFQFLAVTYHHMFMTRAMCINELEYRVRLFISVTAKLLLTWRILHMYLFSFIF